MRTWKDPVNSSGISIMGSNRYLYFGSWVEDSQSDTVCKEYVASAFSPGDHGSTAAAILACNTGYAVLSTIINDGLCVCATLGVFLKNQCVEGKIPVLEVRGKGLMIESVQ